MAEAKTLSLFTGCIAPLRYPGVESATREVLNKLGVKFVDLNGASCCPAPGVIKSFDQKTWLALAARNLALSEEKKADLLTICNGCYGTLFDAAHILNGDEKTRKSVNELMARKYNGTVKVRHLVEFLYKDVGLDAIKSHVKNKQNIDVAVHYGCHFLKPSKLRKLDNPERPRILDDLVEALGAKSVNYRDKAACCGAGGGVRARNPDVALAMTKRKLESMNAAGVKYIVQPCPFCHLQFDRGQEELKWANRIPVLHISQLMALAFGVDKAKLGFSAHTVPVNL
jgi:heterodisulfide reductase subunit B